MGKSIVVILALGALSLCGACARGPELEPVRIRPGQPIAYDEGALRDRPIVVEFHEGDVIPFEIKVEGELVASPPDVSIPLTAKRTFFLLIDPKHGGLKTSLDGRDFDSKPSQPGSFRLGMGVTREKGARAELFIKTPTR